MATGFALVLSASETKPSLKEVQETAKGIIVQFSGDEKALAHVLKVGDRPVERDAQIREDEIARVILATRQALGIDHNTFATILRQQRG